MDDLGNLTEIIIDSREPKKMDEKFIEYGYNVNRVQVNHNEDSYDYHQDGVSIERKTIPDFIQSFQSNHIWDQMKRMMGYKASYLIIVHNGFKDFKSKNFIGAKASISVRYQIPIIEVKNEAQFIYTVGKIFKMHREGMYLLHRNTTLKVNKKLSNIAITTLSTVKTISEVTAIKICKILKLNSLYDLLELTEKKLTDIKGIGKKKAETIILELGIKETL